MLNQKGFSLLEMLMVLLLSGMVFLTISQFIVLLQQQTWLQYQRSHLYTTLNQGMLTILKDLRRAGFCADRPLSRPAIKLNVTHSCVVIHYDLDKRGCWDAALMQPKASDYFAYRFWQRNIEYRRGPADCHGSNWERIFDQHEIVIDQFQIEQIADYLQLTISGHSLKHPSIAETLHWVVKSENNR